jgi:VCBS repeat-containing protein
VYDLAQPVDLRSSYGVRLTDRSPSINKLGDDVAELIVRRTPAGDLVVTLRDVDFVDDLVRTVGTIPLAPTAGETQIALRFMHVANTDRVTAAFDYLSAAGLVTRTESFASGVTLFGADDTSSPTPDDNENWTRPEIIAFAPATADSFIAGTYGTFVVNQAGRWDYYLRNGDPAVQALNTGETREDTFQVVATDDQGAQSSPYTVTIEVRGTDEQASSTSAASSRSTASPPPSANADAVRTHLPSRFPIPESALLFNDRPSADGATLTVQSAGPPGVATHDPGFAVFFEGSSSGSFTYTIVESPSAATSSTQNSVTRVTSATADLVGTPGDDILVASPDTAEGLTGDAGRDVFVLAAPIDGNAANIQSKNITDYTFGDDAIDLTLVLGSAGFDRDSDFIVLDGDNGHLDLLLRPNQVRRSPSPISSICQTRQAPMCW